jgi:hypothetical protein
LVRSMSDNEEEYNSDLYYFSDRDDVDFDHATALLALDNSTSSFKSGWSSKFPPEDGYTQQAWETAMHNVHLERVRLGIALPEGAVARQIKGYDDGGDRETSRKSTIDRYLSNWRTCLDICLILGRYKCAIILDRRNCPENPPPMLVSTVALIIQYLTKGTTEKLIDKETSTQVTCQVTGTALLCSGRVSSESTVKSLNSSLSKLHSHYWTTSGDFQDVCQDCVTSPGNIGCLRHLYQPHLVAQGNPCKDKLTQVYFKTSEIDMVEVHNGPRKNVALHPSEVRRLRHRFITNNTKPDLMYWTLVILGIRGFLRSEEALALKMEDFPPEFFIVKEDIIEQLAMVVKGKRDKAFKLLKIEDGGEPDLSSMRMTLLWVAISGIKSGYIFPSLKELQKMAADPSYSSPTEHFAYIPYRTMLSGIIESELGYKNSKKESYIIGTHVVRTTAYLFAHWGIDPDSPLSTYDRAQITASARHQDGQSIAGYIGASPAVYRPYTKRGTDPDYSDEVGKWSSIFLQNVNSLDAARIKRHFGSSRGFVDLAEWFVFTACKVPRDFECRKMTMAHICKLVLEYRPGLSVTEQSRLAISELIPPCSHHALMPLLDKYEREIRRIALSEVDSSKDNDGVPLIPTFQPKAVLQSIRPASCPPVIGLPVDSTSESSEPGSHSHGNVAVVAPVVLHPLHANHVAPSVPTQRAHRAGNPSFVTSPTATTTLRLRHTEHPKQIALTADPIAPARPNDHPNHAGLATRLTVPTRTSYRVAAMVTNLQQERLTANGKQTAEQQLRSARAQEALQHIMGDAYQGAQAPPLPPVTTRQPPVLPLSPEFQTGGEGGDVHLRPAAPNPENLAGLEATRQRQSKRKSPPVSGNGQERTVDWSFVNRQRDSLPNIDVFGRCIAQPGPILAAQQAVPVPHTAQTKRHRGSSECSDGLSQEGLDQFLALEPSSEESDTEETALAVDNPRLAPRNSNDVAWGAVNYQSLIKQSKQDKATQLSLCVKAVEDIVQQLDAKKVLNVKNPIRDFMNKILRVVNCYVGCHGSNVDAFSHCHMKPNGEPFQVTACRKCANCSRSDFDPPFNFKRRK